MLCIGVISLPSTELELSIASVHSSPTLEFSQGMLRVAIDLLTAPCVNHRQHFSLLPVGSYQVTLKEMAV